MAALSFTHPVAVTLKMKLTLHRRWFAVQRQTCLICEARSSTSKCYSDVLLDSLSLLNGIKRMFTQPKDTRSSHSCLKGL